MPLIEDFDKETLLLQLMFHIGFLRRFGIDSWITFIEGVDTTLSKNDYLATFYLHSAHQSKGDSVYGQNLIQWEPPEFEFHNAQAKLSIHSEIVLFSGKSLNEFIDTFPGLFKKYDVARLKREMDEYADSARDAGHKMFPGLEDYIPQAAQYLSDYFDNHIGSKRDSDRKNKIYSTYLRCGYEGKDNLKSFVKFLNDDYDNLNDEAKEVRNALIGGLSDSFASAVESLYREGLRETIRTFDFPVAVLGFDKIDDRWEVRVPIKNFLEFFINNSMSKDGKHIAYAHIDETGMMDEFLGDDKIEFSDNYPFPQIKDIDFTFGFDYFSDQFPDKILQGML